MPVPFRNEVLERVTPHGLARQRLPDFMKGEEAARRVKDAFTRGTYERLLALKSRYDPEIRKSGPVLSRTRLSSPFATIA